VNEKDLVFEQSKAKKLRRRFAFLKSSFSLRIAYRFQFVHPPAPAVLTEHVRQGDSEGAYSMVPQVPALSSFDADNRNPGPEFLLYDGTRR